MTLKRSTALAVTTLALLSLPLHAAAQQVASWPLDAYRFEDPLNVMDEAVLKRPVLPGDATAPECPDPSITQSKLALPDLILLAICRRPELAAVQGALRERMAAIGVAGASRLPRLNATVSPQQSSIHSSFGGSTVTGRSSSIALNWRIFDFGTRDAEEASALAQLQAVIASRDAQLQAIIDEVIDAYFKAEAARTALLAREAATQLARQSVESTLRRETRGAASGADSLAAKAALARALVTQTRAKGDYDRSLVGLASAVALPPGTRLDLEDPRLPPPTESLDALEVWLAHATQNHPSILAAQAQLKAAQQKVESVARQGWPAIDFVTSYYKNGYPNQALQPGNQSTRIIGFQLSIPLFEGFERTYQIRSAQASAEQSEAQLKGQIVRTAQKVAEEHAGAVSALTALNATEEWVTLAGSNQASAQRRYERGAADIIELLNAQNGLIEAQDEQARSRAAWLAARLRLVASAAMFGQSTLMQRF